MDEDAAVEHLLLPVVLPFHGPVPFRAIYKDGTPHQSVAVRQITVLEIEDCTRETRAISIEKTEWE